MKRLSTMHKAAGKKISDKDIARIEKLTDNNDHNEAMLEVAKLLGMSREVKILELISKIQMIEGHMPTFLGDYRYKDLYSQRLKPEANKTLFTREDGSEFNVLSML